MKVFSGGLFSLFWIVVEVFVGFLEWRLSFRGELHLAFAMKTILIQKVNWYMKMPLKQVPITRRLPIY